MKHNHSTTSNTDEVFRTFIGCKVKGMVQEITFEKHNAIILIFDCAWGLAFNSSGSHWTVSPDDVQRLIRRSKKKLEETQKELENI